jgi:hypothetical protein
MIRWIIGVYVYFHLHLLGMGIRQSQGVGLLERMVRQKGCAKGSTFLALIPSKCAIGGVHFSGTGSHFGEIQGAGEDADFDFLSGAEVAAFGWECSDAVG